MASTYDTFSPDSTADQASRPSVVITGMGVVSPIGVGHAAYWDSLLQQRSGVSLLPATSSVDLPLRIGGAVKDFDAKAYVKPRKALKVMCREIQTGFSAAAMAVENAGWDAHPPAPERLGVIFGSEMLYCEPEEMVEVYGRCIEEGQFHIQKWGEVFMSTMYPLWMLMYLPNMIACHVGIAHDARGPNNTICQGDASSLLAFVEAVSVIQRGHADVMITGGSSSRLSMSPMLYRGIQHLSPRTDQPEAACRPFDADRDGSVNGEGAAAFVLERESHARARGAKIWARVRGCGLGFAPTAKDPRAMTTAVRRSLEKALLNAQVPPTAIGHVNAHAAGLVVEDAAEAVAIHEVLGETPVVAPKSYFGSLGAGGGAVELVASLLALNCGQVPVTLNYRRRDPECPVRVVQDKALPAAHPTAAVLSQSSTGQAVALVLEAADQTRS